MLFAIIASLVVLLLFVVIGYNIVQQYKQKMAAQTRAAISKQRAIITEVEELLLNATRMPFSKSLLLVLQNRIRNALILILKTASTNTAARDHLRNTDAQIKDITANYIAPDENAFRAPDNDKEALGLLQVAKKLRAVLRSEHAKGKINSPIFTAEDRRLEIMQLKVNIENGIKRIIDAKMSNQIGSANQMIDKLLAVLSKLPDRDSYLDKKQAQLLAIQEEIKIEVSDNNDKDLAAIKAKEEEKQNDLDVLFQEKKKW